MVRLSDEQIFGCMRNVFAGRRRNHLSLNGEPGIGTHSDQLAAVRADRSLLPQAIEEGVRWETPLQEFYARGRP